MSTQIRFRGRDTDSSLETHYFKERPLGYEYKYQPHTFTVMPITANAFLARYSYCLQERFMRGAALVISKRDSKAVRDAVDHCCAQKHL